MKNLSKVPYLVLSVSLLFYACSRENNLEPVSTKESLKTWYLDRVDHKHEESIIWENWKLHPLADSPIAYEIPISTMNGLKELFIFQKNGKQDAFYKEFNVTPAGLEIKISSLSGRILKIGVIAKKHIHSKKRVGASMREMNEETAPLVERGYLSEFIFVGVRLSPTDWGNLGSVVRYNTNVVFTFMDSMNFAYGGGGGSSGELGEINFKDYNYSEISSELTNECLIAVLNEMQSKNIYGEIAGILSLFKETKVIPIFNFRIKEMTFKEQFEGDTKDYYGQQKNGIISLNTRLLANASKEFIAKVIMHEMLHKFILEDPVIKEYDHTVMLDKFVKPMSFFINQLYGLAERDAFLISLAGLSLSPHYKNIIKNDSSLSESIIRQAEYNYTTQKKYGTHCN
jgi:hypothetical protein